MPTSPLRPAALMFGSALLVAAPPAPRLLAGPKAEFQLLQAYDEGRPLPDLRVAPKDRPSLQWLRNTATADLPENPFRPGSPAHREAEALRALIQTPAPERPARLADLGLKLRGTQLALWRWGQALERRGELPKPLRQAWEGRLLALTKASYVPGYALRHALCLALAERDEARFAELRNLFEEEATVLLLGFQRLFGLLGAPSQPLRLWEVPSLGYADLRLDQLGARRVWICPATEALPDLPPDTAWVVPTTEGQTREQETALADPDRLEGEELARRLRDSGRKAWLAPTRGAWEAMGLAFFPILIELDDQGAVTRIAMGDAAPLKP